MRKRLNIGLLAILFCIVGLGINAQDSPVEACGGLFCQTTPVLQEFENIIFTVNGDGTVSAYVQITFSGNAPNFSWVVPVPSVPEVDVAEIELFEQIADLTAPQFIAPPVPQECIQANDEMLMATQALRPTGTPPNLDSVDVLAQGNVGPYDFAVVDSPEPDALIAWLRINGYQVFPPMEPLIYSYNRDGMILLAMKLEPEAGVQDIQPVKMTYESDLPMIPLRLTAVAAVPNMAVLTWIFADSQAVPNNYARPSIDDKNIRFSLNNRRNHNYQSLVNQTVDLYEGRAFITEFAGSTASMMDQVSDPTLIDLVDQYPYVTRFYGRLSPEEMTVDPTFTLNADLPDVSNIHDLSEVDPQTVYTGCDAAPPIDISFDTDVVPDNWE